VEPCHQEAAGLTEVYLRAHFDFNPRQDRLIPSQDAGLGFRRGDILMVLNQEDSFWWQVCTYTCTRIRILDDAEIKKNNLFSSPVLIQAVHFGDRSVAGLIPSQTLEERFVAVINMD
jgi:hypothetical protein